jgi:uncharacterized protein with ParB-like and HNH nuclease domain
MSYESKCIRDIIVDGVNRDIFLPAIQREYVWDTSMIERLFDSIMGDYPISSFLFWKIKEENKKDWTTYEFIKDFDSEDPHNEEADLSGINKDVYLVLDGQQRLTSLYIGLKGSYSYFHYRSRETKLFLNIAKKPVKNENNPEELTYQFEFLEGNPINSENEIWFRVSNILDFLDAEDAKTSIEVLINSYSEEIKTIAKKLIGQLHSRVHTYKLINYYEEKSQDYDKVVEVFIRANTGGKKLDYSDILLSTATAKWKNLNAREELNTFTDDINKIGDGYSFDKDFVLKSALFLTENLPIQYKVKNFTKENLEKIENNWIYIKDVLIQTVHLVNKFGFNRNNITSTGALLPISLFLGKLNKKNYYLSTEKNDAKNQELIQKWLIISLVKGSFGGSSDTTLKKVRDVVISSNATQNFPFQELNDSLLQEPKFSDIEIENILKVQYKTKYSFLILSLLYPDRDWKDNQYHEDHIFPKTDFTESKLKKRNYKKDVIAEYLLYYNSILNLELLTPSENLSKNATPFESWITTRDNKFKKRHSIPELTDYSLDNFIEFVNKRKEIIKDKLKEIKV